MESAADGMIWRKASYSGNNGGGCVEVGVWRKASYSGNNGGDCVEVAPAPASVAVRDSKDPEGPRLAFSPGDWREFTARIKDGQIKTGWPGPA